METILILVSAAVILGIIFIIFKLKDFDKHSENSLMMEYIEALRKDINDSGASQRRETQGLIERLNDRLSQGLKDNSETIQKQFSQSAKIVKDVTEQLVKLDETNKQVLNFSEKMQSLENILKNPKQRGILGEYFLESLLSQVFQPNQYKIQYKFENGEIVDAAIFFNEKVIPIDAKFSLEKYNMIMEEKEASRRETLEKEFKMDIKRRIDETSKYIRIKENTTDFAFMFIPAEGIYYNLLIYKVGNTDVSSVDLLKYAFDRHVIIVSPTSFFAYLQTVLHGLKALKMEESVKEIIKKVEGLGKHMMTYENYMQKLGNNLGTTVNMYNSAYKEYVKIDKDVYKITEGEAGGEAAAILLDKPNVEI
ncbi:MAG: DNA recombination protein RmuC [Candidatus Gracilibacteria bacterium]|jgi:DNA recombination protein RmuC